MSGGYIDPYGFSKAVSAPKPRASSSNYIDPYGFKGGKPSVMAHGNPASRHGGSNPFHWLSSKLALAGHDIAQMPGGIYQVGKGVSHDVEKAKAEAHLGGSKRAGRGPWQTPGLARGMAKSALESIKHPLRDPFQTALNVAPMLDVAGRVGEAGIAAKAADAAAGESRVAEAGKALVRRHGAAAPRKLRGGGTKETNLIPSRNAGVRLGQRVYDRTVQGAMNREAQAAGVGRVTARVAAHGKARIGGALAEEQRAVQRINAIPADRLERSALKLSKLPLKAGGKIHSAAMELTSTQTAPEDAALFHEQQAVKLHQQASQATEPKAVQNLKEAAKRNEGVASLYRKVAENDLVHVDTSRPAGQKVFINPSKVKLAHADAALAHLGDVREGIIAKHNLMSPEGQQAAIDNPGRVRAGAEYNAPTPGKLGVPSHIYQEAQAQVAKLEKLHAKAALKAMGDTRNPRSVMHQFAGREMTPEEAQARLAELDKQHADLVEKMVPHVSPYGGKLSRQEQLNRNFSAGKTGKRAFETVKQEEARLADEKMREMAQKHAGTAAWADGLNKMLNERDALRNSLQSHQDQTFFPETKSLPLPHVPANGYPYEMPWEKSPVVQRLSGALSVAKDRLQKLQDAHASRIQPTGLVGGEESLPGRTHISYRSSEKVAQPSPLSAATGKTIGEAQNPILKKPFKGENIQQAKIPKNVALGEARSYRQIAKFENTDSLRRSILEHDASPVKRSPRDILIRKPGAGAKPLSEEMKQAIGAARSATHDQASLDEIHAGTQEGLRALHQFFSQHILDRVETSKAEAVGTKAQDGYAWVDSKMANELQKDAMPNPHGARTKIGSALDNTNSAITAMTVYFKVGHVFTRALTNATTNIMQGSLRPDEAAKSFGLWKHLTPEDQARALGAAGQQGFAALPHEGSAGITGKAISGAARGGSRFWARHFDAPFRFNSLAYELRKVGYDTPEKFRTALDGIQNSGRGMPAHEWSKVSAAFRRADREAISYDRLNEFEKRYLARAIWFYPWVKGSSMFTVRSILEHPYKMAALGNMGVRGRQEQLKELGPVPSYEQGLVALDHGKNPNTADFSTFSPAATLGQLLNIPSVPGGVAQQLNPVLGSGVQYAQGVNQYGEPSNSPATDALQSLVAPTPEAQIAEALAKGKSKNSSARMFPGSGWEADLKRYLLGPGFAHRRVNKAALAKAASREHAKRYTVYGK